MKNIHILPTENPSSLFEIDGHLIINKEQLIQPKYYRNIYITSDEEIKDSEIGTKVCIFKSDSGRITCLAGKGYGRVRTIGKYYEVILTTDQDLIKYGVQAIDDEFLEWFVKNPSCESIKTLWTIPAYKIEKEYRIEFPQEEPKQDTVGKEFYESADKVITVKRQEKKPHSFCETPEEQCTMNYCDENGCQNRVRHLVESKQEQDKKMYSEEELIEIIRQYALEEHLITSSKPDIWFEQFKQQEL